MDCLLHEKSGCKACADSNQSQDIRIEHIEVFIENGNMYGEPDEVNGDVCEELCKKKKPETSHIKVETDTNGTKSYHCTICHKRFHARNHVAYHAYCNGQRKPYQCGECKQTFVSQSHFKYHTRVHRNERAFTCDLCPMSFVQMSKLKRHKLKHTKEKKFSCGQCSKAFNNLSALRKHTLTHTEEKPYSCDTCGRRFRDSSNYRKHVAKHKEPSWSCNLCDHISDSRRAMDQHSRTHGGTATSVIMTRRKHKCPRCPQAFHSRKDMRRHIAVHTDSKPFRCKLCDRRFRRKDNLERHIRNTHPDFLPATAVECDENALKQIANSNADIPTEINRETYEKNEKTKLEILNPLPPLPEEVIQKHITTENVSSNNVRTRNVKTEKVTSRNETDKVFINRISDNVIYHNEREDNTFDKERPDTETYNSEESDNITYDDAISEVVTCKTEVTDYVILNTGAKDFTTLSNLKADKITRIDKMSIIEANNARQSVIVEKRNVKVEKPPSPENEYVHKIRKAIIPLPPIDQEKFQSVKRGILPGSATETPIKNVEIYKKILYGKVDKDPSEVIQSPKMHWRRKMEQDIKW
ncbi:unnamed protein product [Leptosia nina]|uniref:C2H2-type domain-containing protein n=1 Tax=Leptosia nina TaxID=320188 RepID=A0AAV1J5B0_9NEOP